MRIRAFFLRTSRLGLWLLFAAAVCIAAAGLMLALGHPRAHTLTAYAAVTLAALGVILALPAALFEKDTLR
ncbi:MAG: hypothetical protein IPO93_15450 [Actinobacteria bacterium]|jgi:hypothetical protein|nr:hypothetical protein [Actinomycetota bacterium]